LLPAPNFLIMINPTHIAITYSLPSPFSRVRFEECIYASYLCAVSRFPNLNHFYDVQILPPCFAPGLEHLPVPSYRSQHAAPYWRIGRTSDV
jgi:hypothetical protein